MVVTLGAYFLGRAMQRACKGSALVSPVLIAIILVATVVLATGTDYRTYFAGAQFINFLLGPATIALAIPLARNIRLVRENLHSIGLALLAGSVTSIVTGVGIVWLLGGSRTVALSIAPKAVTTPIAMAVSEQIGGIPALTAAFAIIGGIVAAMAGRQLLGQMRIHDGRAHGLAAGVAGSGVAAAQVSVQGNLAAAFAGLGIALNGALTALIIPLIIHLWC
ncbi:LrgB family protein [Bradyrhizobium diazoefficiens]|nr:LrgB family protein [Bradyrhizobium diazoefficiens]MBR1106853.1 LrgB family protein [Bradyrhizobium diazoefficiens]